MAVKSFGFVVCDRSSNGDPGLSELTNVYQGNPAP